MTQAPYQQQQGYQPQAQPQPQPPAQYQQAPQNSGYQPQGQPPPQAYQQPSPPQGQAPWQQQAPQNNGYQQPTTQQGYPSQQQGQYQPVAQPGPVQGTPEQAQAAALPDQHDPDSGNDPMLEDVQIFRTGGVAPYMTWSDQQCTGYRRGGTILAVGTDTAKVFGTQEPATWTWGTKKGQQIMCRTLIVQTDERIPGKQDDTGIRTIELKDGSTRFQAAALAIRASSPNDLNFRPGGQIYFTRTGERMNKGGTKSILYQCEYTQAPTDYTVNDAQLMAQNMGDQSQVPVQQPPAPSNGAQQLQQAAAYVASTPPGPAPANGQQPQYQSAPQGAPQQGYQQSPQGQAPWQQQQPAPWQTQGPAPQPQGQQAPPWQNQGPQQQQSAPQGAPPWQAQGPQQQAQPQNGHPFGPSPQQPMQSPYPPQQQG